MLSGNRSSASNARWGIRLRALGDADWSARYASLPHQAFLANDTILFEDATVACFLQNGRDLD